VTEIEELQSKLFPEASCQKLSYMLALYCISQDFLLKTSDVCLVDITYEATEIGIVRDDTLHYSTHTPYGSFSLAREISHCTGVPIHEAFGYLQEPTAFAFMDSLSDKQKKEVESIFEAYVDRVAALFHETGDTLSIPKRILIHTDARSESLFCELIEKATKRAIKSNPVITLLTSKLLADVTANKTTTTDQLTDTAMLSSAQFFHKRNHCSSFEYL
jgi:Tfp pilus assembly PilM family ATPase